MIRTKPPSDVYRDGWDRVFGAESEPEHPRSSDGIDVRVKSWMWFCRVCDCYVSDPENHQFHAVITTMPGANGTAVIGDEDKDP